MSFENSKNNYEKLTLLVHEFLKMKNLDINKVKQIYVNRGPGSFAGIRNSLAIVKAFNVASQIDYYSFSFTDFVGENDIKFENIPALCKKFKVKKNLINPIYLS